MHSKMKIKKIKIILAVLCLFFIAVAAVLIKYVILQPVAQIESLVKVDGTIEHVSIYERTGPNGTIELRVILQEHQATTFWARVNIQELNQTLHPGEVIEFLVNPDFTEGMLRGEIRQVSINGTVISPYQDWVAWWESDIKYTWLFVVVAILIAYFFGFATLRNPGKTARALKKKKYVDEVIPKIYGHRGALVVTINNMPIWREILTSKMKYPPDFGSDLHNELLGRKKVTFENVKQALQSGDKFVVNFRMGDLPEMSIEIGGIIPTDKNQFYSDFLDAILDAWEQNNIKP
jgi:hypothetical protein